MLPGQSPPGQPSLYQKGRVLPVPVPHTISWTNEDDLPSSRDRRWTARHTVPFTKLDSMAIIPGDSIDIQFGGAFGVLFYRLAPTDDILRGRAEWLVDNHHSYPIDRAVIVARPTSCAELPESIRVLGRF